MQKDLEYLKQIFQTELRNAGNADDCFDTDRIAYTLLKRFSDNDISVIIACFDKAYFKYRRGKKDAD